MSKKLLVIVAIIVSLGVGFGGGILVGSHHKKGHLGKNGHRGQHALIGKRSVISGKVINESGSTITIQLPNGSTDIIYTDSNTSFTQLTPITSSKIYQGSTISVVGLKNNNGSISANKIQLK